MAEETVDIINEQRQVETEIIIQEIINKVFHDTVNDTVKLRIVRELQYISQNGSVNISTLMKVFKISIATAKGM